MAEYAIRIEARITARNIESAQVKLEALKKRLEGRAEWVEINLKGEKGS